MALKKLHAVGGQVNQDGWINTAGWCGTVMSFQKEIVSKLVVRELVFLHCGQYKITDAGLAHIGVDLDAAPAPPPVVAGPRYVPPQRELSQRHKVRLSLMRDGALDYMAIPSLHGSTRLMHKMNVKVDDGAPQG